MLVITDGVRCLLTYSYVMSCHPSFPSLKINKLFSTGPAPKKLVFGLATFVLRPGWARAPNVLGSATRALHRAVPAQPRIERGSLLLPVPLLQLFPSWSWALLLKRCVTLRRAQPRVGRGRV